MTLSELIEELKTIPSVYMDVEVELCINELDYYPTILNVRAKRGSDGEFLVEIIADNYEEENG